MIETPFGNTRLHVVKLFVTLLSTENPTINEKLVDLGTFQILLVNSFNTFFFKTSIDNYLILITFAGPIF